MIISLDVFRATGKMVNIEGEPDECEPPVHRFKNVARLNDQFMYCFKCFSPVKLTNHPSVGLPLYFTWKDDDQS